MNPWYRDEARNISVGDTCINTPTAGAVMAGPGYGGEDRRFWGCWWRVNGMPEEAGQLQGCRAVVDDFGTLRRVQ